MPLSREDLLATLSGAGVEFSEHQHEAAMTVDAQEAALAKLEAKGSVIKNLFLKDKKARLYIISALGSTKIELKVMSARLGLGKGGINMAAAELVEEVLKVSQGSVTPFAVANAEASGVTLLLDHKILSEEQVFVHPLVNTSSLGMSPAALQAALKAIGRDAIFVDLEADPKIDKENPPDLAKYVPEAVAPSASQQPASDAPAVPAASPSQSAKPSKMGASDSKQEAKAGGGSSLAAQHRALTDVAKTTEEVLQQVTLALMGCKLEDAQGGVASPYVMARLRADLEMRLNALKNAAYTTGYVAGKGEIVAFANKSFA